MATSVNVTTQDTAEGVAAALLASAIAIYYAIGGNAPADQKKLDLAVLIATTTLGPENPLREVITAEVNAYAAHMKAIP